MHRSKGKALKICITLCQFLKTEKINQIRHCVSAYNLWRIYVILQKTTGNADQIINENEWKMNGEAECMRITKGFGKDKILSISPYIIKGTVLSMSTVLNKNSVDNGKHM